MRQDIAAIRKRPGMYIGNTDDGSGLHNMLLGLVDNALHEAKAGYVSEVQVTLEADGSATVSDDGRGLPTDALPEGGFVAEMIVTTLHAGMRFNPKPAWLPIRVDLDLCIVNALSHRLDLTIWRPGEVFEMRFADAKPSSTMASADKPRQAASKDRLSGSSLTFFPSPSVFSSVVFERETIVSGLREPARCNSGALVVFSDRRGPEPFRLSIA